MFSNKIKEVRRILQLNQTEFAEKLGVSRSIVSEFENNIREPSKEFIIALSKINISLDWFMADKGSMFAEKQSIQKDLLLTNVSNQKAYKYSDDDKNEQEKTTSCLNTCQTKQLTGQQDDLLLTNISNQKTGSQVQNTKDAVANTIESLVLESTAERFNELQEKQAKIDETFSEHNRRLEALESAIRRYEVRQDSGQPDGAGDKTITYLGKNHLDAGGLMVAESPALYGYAHKADTVSLPLALNLAAGIPIEACDVNETYRVSKKLLKKGKQYCVAKIKGTSMTEAGIADGAFVLLEYTGEPASGAIMVVKYGDNTTLKRLHEREDGIWELLYEDGSGAKIELKEGCWEVKGKMIRVV